METPRLLEYLSADTYLSGEAVATRLGVSRAAVWKEIESLRHLGYDVEAVPHKGYRLAIRPDRLYPWEIAGHLKTSLIGQTVMYYPLIESTNDLAKMLVPGQPEEGTVIVAESQTAGRGRLGRSWSSADGQGIWMSLILRPRLPLAELPKLTMMAAVAVRAAIADTTDLPALIKWPNDLLVNGKKVCGILAELSGEADSMAYLILGIGINVNQEREDFPEELRESAGSLRMERGSGIDRMALMISVLQRLEEAYNRVGSEGFAGMLEDCRRFSATIGSTVTVRNGKQTLTGLAETIGEDGGLQLTLDSGETVSVYAGETV